MFGESVRKMAALTYTPEFVNSDDVYCIEKVLWIMKRNNIIHCATKGTDETSVLKCIGRKLVCEAEKEVEI